MIEYVSEDAVNEYVTPVLVVFHPVPSPVTEYVASTISTSHEREQLQPDESNVSIHPIVQNEVAEAAAVSFLGKVLHEKQRQLDHCVRELKREKEKLRRLEERGVVPPHEL